MGAGALMYSGSAQQGSASAFLSLVNLQNSNVLISNDTFLSCWVYPASFDASNGILVNGNNSTFVALDLVFTDGTDTRSSASIVDANGIGLDPNSQSSGGYLKLNQWNRVQVALGALAGKTVDHIDVGWHRPNATLGYLGFIDDVLIIDAHTSKLNTNTAALDAAVRQLEGLLADGRQRPGGQWQQHRGHRRDGAIRKQRQSKRPSLHQWTSRPGSYLHVVELRRQSKLAGPRRHFGNLLLRARKRQRWCHLAHAGESTIWLCGTGAGGQQHQRLHAVSHHHVNR